MGGLFFKTQEIKYPKLIPTIAPIIILQLFSNISNVMLITEGKKKIIKVNPKLIEGLDTAKVAKVN